MSLIAQKKTKSIPAGTAFHVNGAPTNAAASVAQENMKREKNRDDTILFKSKIHQHLDFFISLTTCCSVNFIVYYFYLTIAR